MILLAALYIFTVTYISHIKGKTRNFVHTVVHQSTLCSVACIKLECEKGVVVTY